MRGITSDLNGHLSVFWRELSDQTKKNQFESLLTLCRPKAAILFFWRSKSCTHALITESLPVVALIL